MTAKLYEIADAFRQNYEDAIWATNKLAAHPESDDHTEFMRLMREATIWKTAELYVRSEASKMLEERERKECVRCPNLIAELERKEFLGCSG